MPARYHKANTIEACMRELRKRHTANPRRMYARRVVDFADMDIPVVSNPAWYYAVAARWWRWHGKEDA